MNTTIGIVRLTKKHRDPMRNDIEMGIRAGKFWHNSPKYQTNWNVFQDFTDLKMAHMECF